jgi:hypothetical protein
MADETHANDGDEESNTDVFALAPLNYDVIRGERTFESVLYSRENAKERVPVNVRTGEKTVDVSSEEKAKRFAENKNHGGCQCVAVPKTPDPMGETRSAPYVSVVFFNEKVVNGKVVGKDDYGTPQFENDGRALEWTYRAAVQSDAYKVELVAADYQTGDVTIRVESTEGSR